MLQSRVVKRVAAGALAILAAVTAAAADNRPREVPQVLKEFESAASLVAGGKFLYDHESNRIAWGQMCHNSLGLSNQGDFREAVRTASQVLFIGETNGNFKTRAYASRDLAYAYNFAGDTVDSEKWAKEALRVGWYYRDLDRDKELIGPTNKILGDNALRRGDAQAAIKYFDEAIDTLGRNSKIRGYAQVALANAYRVAGDPKTARARLDEVEPGDDKSLAAVKSLAVAELSMNEAKWDDAIRAFEAARAAAGDDRYHLVFALAGKARAQRAKGDLAAANATYAAAAVEIERLRGQFRSDQIKAGLQGSVAGIFDDAVAAAFESGQVEAAFDLSERARARLFVDQVRERVKTSTALSTATPTANAAQARQALLPGSILVSYYVLPEYTIAFRLDSKDTRAVKIAIGARQLQARVQAFRALVEGRSPAVVDEAATLYKLLLEPVAVPKEAHLIVVPHRSLHFLPFHALRDGTGWLIEHDAVSYELSASLMVGQPQASAPRDFGNCLALGNPDLKSPDFDLPGAEAEVDAIAKEFATPKVFVRGNATRAALLENVKGMPVVHVAAHAMVDEIDPMSSVVKLAAGTEKQGDVEARDLMQANLRDARIFALSACDSGLGRVSSGDEFWGFTRAILASGAQTAVVSLWPAEDAATAYLMTQFYHHARTQPLAEAMRSAQRELIARAPFDAPASWAAFTLVGYTD